MIMDDKGPYELLGAIRDKLLPLVETDGNLCGDMRDCTASSPDCVECLVDRIIEQYKNNIEKYEKGR